MTGNPRQDSKDWKRMRFKTNKVWMAVDSNGAPLTREGKVLIKYQLKQDYEYWVNIANVVPLDAPPEKAPPPSRKEHRKKRPAQNKSLGEEAAWDETSCRNKICIFTDGASSGNPGPAGIGVVLRYDEHEKEISEFIGNATNNVAELQAIRTGLSAVKDRSKPVRLFTDSKYAYGLLMLNWKAQKNQQLVASIKEAMTRFRDLKILKVKGHAGHPANERADYLATSAIKKAAR
jgi:ribonuclease HI